MSSSIVIFGISKKGFLELLPMVIIYFLIRNRNDSANDRMIKRINHDLLGKQVKNFYDILITPLNKYEYFVATQTINMTNICF